MDLGKKNLLQKHPPISKNDDFETKKKKKNKQQFGTILYFLDTYIYKDIYLHFNTIDKFFVEMVSDSEHNPIIEIRSFKYIYSLDKYSKDLSKGI